MTPEDKILSRLNPPALPIGGAPGAMTPDERILARMQEQGIPTSAEEDQGWLPSLGNAAVDYTKALISPLALLVPGNTEQDFNRLRATAAGVVSGAILTPLAGLAGLPGAFTDKPIITDSARDFLVRAREGLFSDVEQRALAAGVSEDDITASYNLGNFVGMVAPIGASIKVAGMALRVPVKLGRHVLHGDIVTDFAGGLIYGAAFTDGELQERVKAMAAESAMFGVARIIIAGVAVPLRAMRINKIRHLTARQQVARSIDQMEKGQIPIVPTSEAAQDFATLVSQEGFISNSAAAQDILVRSATEATVVQAILDVQRARGSMGIVRSVGSDFFETQQLADQFRKEFPALKFDVVKRLRELSDDTVESSRQELRQQAEIMDLASEQLNKAGDTAGAMTVADEAANLRRQADEIKGNTVTEYDVFFGTKGLSNTQRKQLAKKGRFTGQAVYKNGAEYEYVGPSNKAGHISVKTVDGKLVAIKDDVRVSDLPFGQEEMPPFMDALYQQFFRDVQEQSRSLLATRGGASSDEVIEALRAGQLDVDTNAVREMDIGGAITYPEELGELRRAEVTPAAPLTQTSNGTIDSLWKVVDPNSGKEFHIETTFDPRDGSAYFEVFAEGQTISPAAWKAGAQRVVEILEENNLPVTHLVTRGRRAGDPPIISIPVEKVMHNTPKRVAAEIDSTGLEHVYIMEPVQPVHFERVFDEWASRNGITGSDLVAARASFSRRLFQDLWNDLDPDIKKQFDKIRTEFESIADDIPFAARAHQSGFHAYQEGNEMVLREINSGASVRFANQDAAEAFLQNFVRGDRDLVGSIIDFNNTGLGAVTGGLDEITDHFYFGNIAAKDFLENIPSGVLRNVRDLFIDIEQKSQLQLFSQGFDLVDTGHSRMKNRYEPWAYELEKTWGKLGMKERTEVVEKLWAEVDGSDLTLAQAMALGRQRGLNGKQLAAFKRARAIFDEWHRMGDIPDSRFINLYYTRVRPYAEANGGQIDFDQIFKGYGGVPPEFQFWAEMARSGDLANIEKDPLIVMHKYIRGLLFKQEVKPHWDRMAKLVGAGGTPPLRVGDLSQAQQIAIRKNAMGDLAPEDPVLPKPIRDVLKEYLTIVRGNPSTALLGMREFTRKLFNALDIESDTRVTEEYLNAAMSSMYGAAMGLRPSLVARNLSQNVWNVYTRIGNKHAGSGLKAAMSLDGFNEVVEAGGIRLNEAGIPYGDTIFEELLTRAPVGKGGVLSMAVASAARVGLRLGYLSRKTAEKFLIPYSNADHMNRAWAYHWQKQFTEEWLQKFERGAIDWDTFSEKAMPFFAPAIKQKFEATYQHLGREQALRFIGKMSADEANFIYGVGAQPAWMQKPFGRFVGMFGTWPLWQAELYFRRMKYATMGQQMAFAARNAILIGAFTNMGVQSGLNVWSWIAPGSIFGWSGGPAVDHAINLKRVIDAPLEEKASAMQRFGKDIFRLSVPGQVFVHDLHRALDADTPGDAFLMMMMGRPSDVNHWSLDWQYFNNEPQYQDPSGLYERPGRPMFELDKGLGAVLDPRRGLQMQSTTQSQSQSGISPEVLGSLLGNM